MLRRDYQSLRSKRRSASFVPTPFFYVPEIYTKLFSGVQKLSCAQRNIMATAPFTADQIEAFNRFQASDQFHPMTCGNRGLHSLENEGVLVADESGLFCPTCDYRQDWCHSFQMERF